MFMLQVDRQRQLLI